MYGRAVFHWRNRNGLFLGGVMITLWILIGALMVGALWEDIKREISYLGGIDCETYPMYDKAHED